MNEPAPPAAQLPATGRKEAVTAWRWPMAPILLVAVLALGLITWQWLETRDRFDNLQQELARRLADSDTTAKESRALARQSLESLQGLQTKLGVLEAKLAESQGQQDALEVLYQELTRNSDDRLLAEIEQTLAIAAQQLQLAGNVEAALIALASADARLASANRPQLLVLRKLLNRDIDKLKALPLADTSGMALRLEGIVTAVDTLPLAFEAPAREESAKAVAGTAGDFGFWRRLLSDMWSEIRQLVRVERLDRPDPALLSPAHAFFLRENLKLRLLNARLALLQRDGKTFRNDLKQTQLWLERYFDAHDKRVMSAITSLKQLGGADISLELPSLNDSLSALRNAKAGSEKSAAGGR